jgi:hypothetical protein
MAWEWLEKYLKGQAPVGDFDTVERSRGLFGVGGNYGQGGLLTNFQQPDSDALFGRLQNPGLAIGASLFTKGMKGEDIGTAAFPAVKEGLTFSESVARLNTARKKRKYIQDYKDKVPPEDMEIFMAFPEKYITAKLSKEFSTPSLSKEALALYQVAKTKGSGDDFKEWFKTLPKADQDLYNKQIRPNISRLEAILSAGIDNREKLKEVRNPTDEELETLRKSNPGKSDKELIKWFRDNWKEISANL